VLDYASNQKMTLWEKTMKQARYLMKRRSRECSLALLTAAALAGWVVPANAYTFNTSSDWDVELDTAFSYSLGIRAQPIDPLIGNNPIQQNDEYKFPDAGDITSNRFEVAPELSIAYQDNTGVDVSLDAWKDFAYNGGVATNPGEYAPGVPYSALSSSPDGHYGAYTNNYYNVGAELENAFAFKNFSVAGIPVEVKVGRFTEYWGNALFSGAQAISYGQSPIDIIKAVDSPGTEVKDLFLPRGQASVHIQVSPELTLGFQYQFEYRYDQFPEGGTFLGVADPFFIGPETLEGTLTRANQNQYNPPNVDGNFGVEVLWSPAALNGTIGFYGRQFDDVAAYSPFQVNSTNGTYHLAYARHVHLFGLSLDNNIGLASTSFELSVRQNTGLVGVAGASLPSDPTGIDGPRGNTLNFIANAIYGLTPSPLWQTGSLVGEIAYTHVLAVTHDPQLYDAEGYACAAGGLNAGNGERDGCATANEVNVNVLFDPQWLQVFPGIDVDAPISAAAGLYGNGQTLALAGTGSVAGSVSYGVGIHALIKQKYNIKLDYSGFQSPTGKIAYTPSGLAYYSTGSGNYMWNDKGQIQLTFSTAF
jgi:hypothetical protein